MASGLVGDGLAISCHKLVEDGARTMILLAPGLFRLDVRPVEDTLQVMTRSLHAEEARWRTEQAPVAGYGKKAQDTPEPYRLEFSFYLELEPCAIIARILLNSTVDKDRGLTHLVAQAVAREVSAGGGAVAGAPRRVASAPCP
ncbi:MAG TPA: hypothetical protein VES79_00725 [Solirubrobacteraceae bacterium]|nr:hypothetical protein [Solirubrobacteraceae bacterium]